MGKKGGSTCLKRYKAPRFWPIHVKEATWTPKPRAGPHPSKTCLPLLLVIRDLLGYANTAKEAKAIISEGDIKVDGKTRRDFKYPTGLMDVIELPKLEKAYRVLPVPDRGLRLVEIPKKEAAFKLCRIEAKTTVKDAQLQLNLHDGKSNLVKISDPAKPVEDTYKVKDTLKIGLPNQEIQAHLHFDKDAFVIVSAGTNQGKVGKIKNISEGTTTRSSTVSIETSEGEIFQTLTNYAFTVGEGKPEITLPSQPIS